MTHRTPCRARFIFCGFALASCAQESPGGDRLDAVPHLTIEEEMRLGDVDDPDVGFSMPGAVDVDRDGNIYVLEAAVPEIRVFEATGALIHRIGRRGEGPGEFEGAPRFGVIGDTVWAVSSFPERIALFDRRGDVLADTRAESVLVPLPIGHGYVLPWEMRSDGMFTSHFYRVSFSRGDASTGVEPADSIPYPFVLFDPTGAVSDTIGWAPRPPPRMWSPPDAFDLDFSFVDFGGRRLAVPSPPPAMPWWEPLPDGYLVVDPAPFGTGDAGVFTVTRLGLTGDTAFHRELVHPPVPYSAADLDSIAARAARGEAGGGVPYSPGASAPPDWEPIAATLRAEMSFPEFRLPIDREWVAQDESIWLRLSGTNPAVASWLILDEAGRPRGRLELPSSTRVVWARGDTFWAVETDELGIPWVVRYRTVRGP